MALESFLDRNGYRKMSTFEHIFLVYMMPFVSLGAKLSGYEIMYK
jgi:hypothetical protein